MPRIRTIKPEFWSDEKIGPLSPLDRLVFLGLVSMADDAGRLVDSVRKINGDLFPHTDDNCGPSLDRLAEAGVIRRGATSSGQRVIQVAGWTKHQKIDKPNTKTQLPEIVRFDDVSTTCRRRGDERSTTDARQVDDASAPHTSDQGSGSGSVDRARADEPEPRPPAHPALNDIVEAVNRPRRRHGLSAINAMTLHGPAAAPFFALAGIFPHDTLASIEAAHDAWIATASPRERADGYPWRWWLREPDAGLRRQKPKEKDSAPVTYPKIPEPKPIEPWPTWQKGGT